MDYVRNIHQLDKVSVYTDTYSCKGLKWFDMDIRCVRTERILNDGSRQLNDRRAVDTLSRLLVDTESVVVAELVFNALQQRGGILGGVVFSYRLDDSCLC